RRAGGHREGQVQPQPGLGAFGGTADHTHRRIAPEPFHKPAWGPLGAGNLPHAHYGERGVGTHGPRQTFRWRLDSRAVEAGKRWVGTRGHLQTLTFFLSAGRGFLGSKTSR